MSRKHSLVWKIILYLIILAAVFCGLSAIFSWLERTQRNYAVMKRNIVYTNLGMLKKNSVDVLILGDSETYAAISPLQLWKETGMTAYVAGQPGQRPAESYSLLQEALKRQSLKLVILETDGLGKSDVQEAIGQRLAYFVPILRNHNIWKEWVNGSYRTDVNYRGFRIRQGINGYTGSADYMTKKGKGRQLGEVDDHYVRLMKALCEKCGARLQLLSIPSPKNYNKTRLKNLETFASQLGLPYLDMNQYTDQIGLDWSSDTSDKGDHLNLFGAQKVTAWLTEKYFKEQGLADHRNDPAYADWDQEYEGYEQAVENITAQMENAMENVTEETATE